MRKFLSLHINIIILFFVSTIISFYLLTPILIHGTEGIFFSLDPDAHYIGNVISYIKSNQISYINHPATPTIMIYVIALTPLRFYTKLVLHTNFINWFILHSEVVYLYLRILESILFGLGLFIFSLSVYRITRSLVRSVFSIFSLFTFGFFTDIVLHIRSETTSFLIISIWLFIFVSFIYAKKLSQNFLLIIISSLAIANKFTNIFYFIAALSLIPAIKGISRLKKIFILFIDIFLGFISFLFFTWPIRQKYPQIIQYIFNLFPQSGVIIGNNNALFDIKIYFHNMILLFQQEFWSTIIVILTFVLITDFFHKKMDKNRLIPSFAYIIFAGILIFVRYPLSYYQLTHFVGLIFVLHILLRHYNKLSLFFFLIVFFVSIKSFIDYYPQISNSMNQSKNLDDYVSEHPSQKGTIWERGDTKDFALLWGNSWSGSSYSEDLAKLRPDLLFEIYFQQNYIGDKRDIFKICWDKFYMKKSYFNTFINKYKDYNFTYSEIPKTENMYVVERNNCEA